MQEYFRANDALKYLGFKSRTTLDSLIADGLPVIKIHNKRLFAKSDIDEFMSQYRVKKEVTNE